VCVWPLVGLAIRSETGFPVDSDSYNPIVDTGLADRFTCWDSSAQAAQTRVHESQGVNS
jgi:hypothetical protein